MVTPTPIQDLAPQTALFADDGVMPNNPVLPAVLIAGAVPPGTSAGDICALMARNGWAGNWTYTVFDYHHYHPNSHEALIAASGWADIQLGGTGGTVFRVNAGDAVVLPAGTGHCRVGSSRDFAICGGYPPGQEAYEIVRAAGPFPGGTKDRIAAVPLPATDPVYGADGPVLQAWSARRN